VSSTALRRAVEDLERGEKRKRKRKREKKRSPILQEEQESGC